MHKSICFEILKILSYVVSNSNSFSFPTLDNERLTQFVNHWNMKLIKLLKNANVSTNSLPVDRWIDIQHMLTITLPNFDNYVIVIDRTRDVHCCIVLVTHDWKIFDLQQKGKSNYPDVNGVTGDSLKKRNIW